MANPKIKTLTIPIDGQKTTYDLCVDWANVENKPEDFEEGTGVQSDWNQSNEESLAYIKNRPFYSNGLVEKEVLPEIKLDAARFWQGLSDHTTYSVPVVGETYKVFWNGVKYECVAFDYQGWAALGNPWMEDCYKGNTGEPFLIGFDGSNVNTFTLEISDHVIEILNNDENEVIFRGVCDVNTYESIYQEIEYPAGIFITPGNTYNIFWDNQKYELTAEDYDGWRVFTSYPPFQIGVYTYDDYGYIGGYAEEPGEHTVRITEIAEDIKKLDGRYLPEGVPNITKNVLTIGTLVDDVYFDYDPDYSDNWIPLSSNLTLIEGNTYQVFLNGEQYECVAWFNSEWDSVCIGNGGLFGIGENSGEPFLCDSYSDGECCFTVAEPGEYWISLAGEALTATFNKLDKNCLPGDNNKAVGWASHAEGEDTLAIGYCSHAEGDETYAYGFASHAEGSFTHAFALDSHAEGYETYAKSEASHAEGYCTHAKGEVSHAEGYETQAINDYSHTEGYCTRAEGESSHAEGSETWSLGFASHAEGYDTLAQGTCSHTEGEKTIAMGWGSHAQGILNIEDSDERYAHIVGNGYEDDDGNEIRSNAHTLDWEGNAWFQGDVFVGGTSQDDADRLVKLSEIDDLDGGENSDWAQNDETAPGYIKNRTHHSTIGESICEETFQVVDGIGDKTITLSTPLQEGQLYEIQINDKIYHCKCQQYESTFFLGNFVRLFATLVGGDVTQEEIESLLYLMKAIIKLAYGENFAYYDHMPFCVISADNELILTMNEPGEYKVKVSPILELAPIDSSFLPPFALPERQVYDTFYVKDYKSLTNKVICPIDSNREIEIYLTKLSNSSLYADSNSFTILKSLYFHMAIEDLIEANVSFSQLLFNTFQLNEDISYSLTGVHTLVAARQPICYLVTKESVQIPNTDYVLTSGLWFSGELSQVRGNARIDIASSDKIITSGAISTAIPRMDDISIRYDELKACGNERVYVEWSKDIEYTNVTNGYIQLSEPYSIRELCGKQYLTKRQTEEGIVTFEKTLTFADIRNEQMAYYIDEITIVTNPLLTMMGYPYGTNFPQSPKDESLIYFKIYEPAKQLSEELIPDTIARKENTVEGNETEFILKSSTAGSTKRFRVTIDDSGVLSAAEIIE